MFNECLVHNKHKVNLNFIHLLRNRLLILICEILKRERILLVKRHVDVEDEEIASTIKRHIVIKI